MFLILKLIVMDGVCIHLTLGGAESDRSLFCGDGSRGGVGEDGSVLLPAPQLGECLRMWRAYPLTSRCMISICLQPSPCRVREGLIPPREMCACTNHGGSLGLAPLFRVELNTQPSVSCREFVLVSTLHNSFRAAFVSWGIPRGLRCAP